MESFELIPKSNLHAVIKFTRSHKKHTTTDAGLILNI